jgi:hypothetical protein
MKQQKNNKPERENNPGTPSMYCMFRPPIATLYSPFSRKQTKLADNEALRVGVQRPKLSEEERKERTRESCRKYNEKKL